MSSDPSLSIVIGRASLEMTALAMSGVDDFSVPIGVANFQEPGLIPRVTYAPSPIYTHGEVPLAWSYQQGLLRFDAFVAAATEANAQSLYMAIGEAITQWPTFPVSVFQSGVEKQWTCHPGSIEPEARTRANLTDHNTIWSVAIPCYPVPVVL